MKTSMIARLRRHLGCCLLAAALAPSVLHAAEPIPPQLPAELFSRLPKVQGATVSPDGTQLAFLAELKGRMNVHVLKLGSNAVKVVSSFERKDATQLRWISDKRLVFSQWDRGEGLADQRGGGLFAVNADGSEGKVLDETVDGCLGNLRLICRQMQFLRRVPGSEDEMVVTHNDRNLRSLDVYRINTVTGRKTLLADERPGEVRTWVLDAKLQPRAVVTGQRGTIESSFWYRASLGRPWQKVASWSHPRDAVTPLDFDGEGTLYVASAQGGERAALWRFDPEQLKVGEKIVAHPRYDLDEARLIFDDKDRRLIGLEFEGDKPEVVWFDPARASLQRGIDQALPGAFNQLRIVGDGAKVQVTSFGDRQPGESYLFDTRTGRLEFLTAVLPWIKAEQMAPRKPIYYKSRDGVDIQAYLTLPVGREPKALPLVVWVHGGPNVRGETWHFDRDAQFFANRGYAVLQVNYRGSTGQGWRYEEAGYKQWGGRMQDDLNDGVQHLVSQGVADPQRLCIGGASYGGYATAEGLARDPGLWKCGINVVGVTDLFWFEQLGYSDFNQSDPEAAEQFFRSRVGDPHADAAMMEANSPRRHAGRVRAPMLIIHGGADVRVPIKHAQGMREALEAAGQRVEWKVYPEEGHGFLKPSNVEDYYSRMGDFLDRHIGDRRPR